MTHINATTNKIPWNDTYPKFPEAMQSDILLYFIENKNASCNHLNIFHTPPWHMQSKAVYPVIPRADPWGKYDCGTGLEFPDQN